jgi:hypothetical protein
LDSRWVLLKGKCLKAIGRPLDNSERVQESHWEVPKYRGQPIGEETDRIAQRLLAKMLKFPSLFSEALLFSLHLLKAEGAVENF